MQKQLEEIVNKYLFEENNDMTRAYIKRELDSFLSGQKVLFKIKDYSVEPVPFQENLPTKLTIKISITQRNKKILIFCVSINAASSAPKKRKSPNLDKYF